MSVRSVPKGNPDQKTPKAYFWTMGPSMNPPAKKRPAAARAKALRVPLPVQGRDPGHRGEEHRCEHDEDVDDEDGGRNRPLEPDDDGGFSGEGGLPAAGFEDDPIRELPRGRLAGQEADEAIAAALETGPDPGVLGLEPAVQEEPR